jgi:hypothetical protein
MFKFLKQFEDYNVRRTENKIIFLSRLYDTIGGSSKILFIFSELYKIFIFFGIISWIFGKAFE